MSEKKTRESKDLWEVEHCAEDGRHTTFDAVAPRHDKADLIKSLKASDIPEGTYRLVKATPVFEVKTETVVKRDINL